jgi:hypothetical protein
VRPHTQNHKIKIENGIRFIAANVYPTEFNGDKDSQRAALKRVRARVQYAFEQRMLTGPDAKKAINRVQLFCWAGEQKDWQALKEEPIPRTNRVSTSMDAILEVADPEIPDDLSRDELGEQLKYCLKDIRQLRRDRAELAEIRGRKAERKIAGSQYGKEGGREGTHKKQLTENTKG